MGDFRETVIWTQGGSSIFELMVVTTGYLRAVQVQAIQNPNIEHTEVEVIGICARREAGGERE